MISKSIPIRENGETRFESIEVPEPKQVVDIRRTRSFTDALGPARLTSHWGLQEFDINRDLISYLELIRNKARSLEISSDYVKRFLLLAESNVVGSDGFNLQVKARKPDGSIDKLDTNLIEKLFDEYSNKKNVSLSGAMSLRQIERFAVRGLLRDGEAFIRKVIRKGSRFPVKLQFIPPEFVETGYNRIAGKNPAQNAVIMGVEIDPDGVIVGYWLRTMPNYMNVDPKITIQRREFVPASEMFHIFLPQRPNQVRGFSALTSTIFALKMLDGIREASMTNFRVTASKMGFFTKTAEGVEYTGDGKDDQGNVVTEVAPGQLEILPTGVDFKSFDPLFPSKDYESFLKSIIRSIASGWGVSYNGIANDYESVNYSSARIAMIEEREFWKTLQKEIDEQFLDPLYEEFLTFAILTQVLPVPESRFDKFNEKKFIGRTWTWIDPKNDAEAQIMSIDNGLKSRSRVCAEQGVEFEDIAQELADEQALAKKLGIVIQKVLAPSPAGLSGGESPDPAGSGQGPNSKDKGNPPS